MSCVVRSGRSAKAAAGDPIAVVAGDGDGNAAVHGWAMAETGGARHRKLPVGVGSSLYIAVAARVELLLFLRSLQPLDGRLYRGERALARGDGQPAGQSQPERGRCWVNPGYPSCSQTTHDCMLRCQERCVWICDSRRRGASRTATCRHTASIGTHRQQATIGLLELWDVCVADSRYGTF